MLSGLCMHNYVLLGVLVCGLAGLLAVVGYSTPLVLVLPLLCMLSEAGNHLEYQY